MDEPGRGLIHQGEALKAWIQKDLTDAERWDLRALLLYREPPVSGEARASATWKNARSPAERKRLNQEPSEKRRDAVVNRLKRNLTGVHRDMGLGVDTEKLKQQIRAIGEDEAAKIGEETVLERMVQIDIKPHDVEKAIKKLYKQDTWWWKPGG